MNPYAPPTTSLDTGEPSPKEGRLCIQCGARNGVDVAVLSPRPSVLWVLLFAWPFLWVRLALKRKTVVCSECGDQSHSKTVGSWIALGLLVLTILVVVASYFGDSPIEE